MLKQASVLAVVLVGLVAGCSSGKAPEAVQKSIPYLTTTKIDVANASKVMEIINPTAGGAQTNDEEAVKMSSLSLISAQEISTKAPKQ